MLGYMIPIDVIGRLLDDYPNITGVVCTTFDLSYLGDLIEIADGRCDVHVGGAQQALTVFAFGGQGFLCPEGVIAPQLCGSLITHYDQGDYPALFRAYNKLMRLAALNRGPGGSLRFTKAAMRALGIPGSYIRPPYLPLDNSDVDGLSQALARLGIERESDAPVPA
jgi:4-hydroxy-tetrahydrodipicolinate synthase